MKNVEFCAVSFGNVDERGKLDKDVLDEDLRETLNSREATEYLDRIFTSVLELDSSSSGNAADNAFRIQPAADAVDYSNFQELAEDQTPMVVVPQPSLVPAASSYPAPFQLAAYPAPFAFQQSGTLQRQRDQQDDYDDDGDNVDPPASISTGFQPQMLPMISMPAIQPFPSMASMSHIPLFTPMLPTTVVSCQPLQPQVPARVFTREQLAEIFPGYDQGRLRFSQLFSAKMTKRPTHLRSDVPKKLRKDQYYEVMRDDRDIFVKCIPARFPIYISEPHLTTTTTSNDTSFGFSLDDATAGISLPKPQLVDDHMLAPIMLEPWEDRILWENNDNDSDNDMLKVLARFRNTHLDKDDWLDAIVFDEGVPAKKVPFHLDDPRLVISSETLTDIQQRARNPVAPKSIFYKHRPDGKLIDRFNISEDWLYEVIKPRTARIRQTHGPVSIQHSLPAIKMHPQYLKPLLQLRELRSFHRPAIKFPIGEDIQFSRPKAVKKRPKEIDPSELMRTPKDISLRDSSKFVLVEYSEEYPLLMQTVGMASLIYNYYRKKDEKDNYIPKMTNGGAYILESVDASPFFGFGDVKPGETRQVLYNNLLRAPIFPQSAPHTDFLIIRHSYHGKVKYFLRDIPNMYIVGQMFPVQEVPRPQARKITQSLKQRLQVVSYRLMWKDTFRRLRFDRLRRFFPMFSDLQIRQKLKEFAQYLKKGENTGWWKLKSNVKLPDEDGIRKIITPEQVCLYQSTLVGQQRLRDAGYGNDDLLDLQNEEDESTLDIEVQLAPWVTTKNFVIAASGKGMVKLFGPGDPTGCGEGFSFIRASMKEMFFKSGLSRETRDAFIDAKARATFHKYSIAEQQKEYKEEIERIWSNQILSLSATTVMDDIDSMDKDLETMRNSKRQLEIEEERERRKQYGYSSASSPAPYSPSAMRNHDDQYSDDEAGSMVGSTLAGKNKVLVISRLIRNEEGDLDWKSEVITDGRVINAYLRHRSLIEKTDDEEGMVPNSIYHDNSVDYSQLSEDEKRNYKQRRTRAHVARLQVKLGKKPTPTDPNEAAQLDPAILLAQSEAELPAEQAAVKTVEPFMQPQQATKLGAAPQSISQTQLHFHLQPPSTPQDQQPQIPIVKPIPPVILKFNLGQPPPSTPSTSQLAAQQTSGSSSNTQSSNPTPSSRKRRANDSSTGNAQPAKVVRRGSPRIELAGLLDTIILEIVGNPLVEPLCQPITAPGYSEIVHTPKTLHQIRNDVRNFKYRSHIDFTLDIELVARNCNLYHGSGHSLTGVAQSIVDRVKAYVAENEEDLARVTLAIAVGTAASSASTLSKPTQEALLADSTRSGTHTSSPSASVDPRHSTPKSSTVRTKMESSHDASLSIKDENAAVDIE
ncbi:hypothetical protein BASA83_003608 [Batrachochytrium salamandrivorans]|nr:hypothetical protein BASA83_003608 [Batrachochytrium salamandrivorans]